MTSRTGLSQARVAQARLGPGGFGGRRRGGDVFASVHVTFGSVRRWASGPILSRSRRPARGLHKPGHIAYIMSVFPSSPMTTASPRKGGRSARDIWEILGHFSGDAAM